jgi:hypothetical protein
MAKWNQVCGAFCAHDAGNPCHAENVTFCVAALQDHGEGSGLHPDAAAGYRDTFGHGLVADVDHVRLAL